MFLSKNIKKTRKKPALLRKKHLQQPLLTKEQKKLPRCRFKEIPPPNKFVNQAPIYVINGDILFMEYNGMLVTELSLFNQFKLCQEVIVEQVAGQKSVLIKLIQKADIDKNVPKWTNLVDRLRKVDNHYTKQWIKTITDFTHTYNKVMQRQSRKKLKSESRKKFFSQVTSQTDHQRETLFKEYPCLQLKFRIKRHHNYLTEVLFTESLVKLLGQSVESFVLTVLHEGLPQIMPFDNPLVNSLIKPLIENYFTIDDQGYRIPEHNTTLLIKNHYARDVKYQAHLFMNYETNTFGLDIIIAILNAGEPYILQDHEFKQINPYFLGSVAKKEIEFCTFLWKYYGLKNLRESLYDDRRCLIRGLDESDDEEIEVKKCEDEG